MCSASPAPTVSGGPPLLSASKGCAGRMAARFSWPDQTAAAVDRIVHHSVILEFDVPGYRTCAAQNRQTEEESDRPE